MLIKRQEAIDAVNSGLTDVSCGYDAKYRQLAPGKGKQYQITGKAGDECLVIFADRCIDFWWQNGGVQEPVDDRVHDLSDAFCIVGPQSQSQSQSQAQKISGISTGAAQLRSDDGSTFFELNPSTQKIKIVAPGGLDIVTPLADFSAKVTIHGLLSWLGGMVGSVVSGVASKITGAVEFIGSVKANGKVIDNTHTHGGVQRGGSNTDEVN